MDVYFIYIYICMVKFKAEIPLKPLYPAEHDLMKCIQKNLFHVFQIYANRIFLIGIHQKQKLRLNSVSATNIKMKNIKLTLSEIRYNSVHKLCSIIHESVKE